MGIVKFDDYAAQVDSWIEKQPALEWIEDFMSTGVVNFGDEVLDCGCGNGKYTALLAAKGFHATGIDIEEKCIEAALYNTHNSVSLLKGDMYDLPFSNTAFNAVLLRYVIHLLPKASRKDAIVSIRNILKTKGYAIIETAFHYQYSQHYDHIIFPRLSKSNLEIYPEQGELVQLLQQAGFIIIDIKESIQTKNTIKTVSNALLDSELLIKEGIGQTAWLRLSALERIEFHQARIQGLTKMFPSDLIPQVWKSSFIVAQKG
jgi:ubiquinone/menaquinone biosynthesis C-methylase UbiE